LASATSRPSDAAAPVGSWQFGQRPSNPRSKERNFGVKGPQNELFVLTDLFGEETANEKELCDIITEMRN